MLLYFTEPSRSTTLMPVETLQAARESPVLQRQVKDLDLVDPQTPGASTYSEQTSENTQEIIRVNLPQQVDDVSRQIQSGQAVSSQQLAQYGNQAMALAATAVQQIERQNPGRPIQIGQLHIHSNVVNTNKYNKAENMNITNNYGDVDSANDNDHQDEDSDCGF